MNYEIIMTEITLLYEIKQILLANTWATAGSFGAAIVALIVAIMAYREAKKNGKN